MDEHLGCFHLLATVNSESVSSFICSTSCLDIHPCIHAAWLAFGVFFLLPSIEAFALASLKCEGLNLRQEETKLQPRQTLSPVELILKGKKHRPKRPKVYQLLIKGSMNVSSV